MRAPQQIKYKGHIYKRAEIDEKRALALTTKLLQQLGAAKTTAEQFGQDLSGWHRGSRGCPKAHHRVVAGAEGAGDQRWRLWPEQALAERQVVPRRQEGTNYEQAPTADQVPGRIYKRAFDDEAMAPELKSFEGTGRPSYATQRLQIKVDGSSGIPPRLLNQRQLHREAPGVERWSCYDRISRRQGSGSLHHDDGPRHSSLVEVAMSAPQLIKYQGQSTSWPPTTTPSTARSAVGR